MSKLRTKDIHIDNHKNVYEYYRENDISQPLSKVAYKSMDLLYVPDVSFAGHTEEQIHEHVADNKPVIFIANHVRYIDQFVVGALLQSRPLLRGLVGRTHALGKVSYVQKQPDRFINDKLGLIPVIREKDLPDDVSEDDKAVLMVKLGRAGIEMRDTAVHRMSLGESIFGFPEGERNTNGDWTKIIEIKSGMAQIAIRAWKQDVEAMIVPIGLAYDTSQRLDWRKPAVRFGSAITKPELGPIPATVSFTEQMQQAIQQNVDFAVAMARAA